jgi:gliding motility-associated-like protein
LEPEPLVANLTIKTPLNCSVPPLLELVVNGGNPGYTFGSDGIVFNKTILNSPEEIEAGIGSYTIYVKDSKGCRSKSNEIRIDSIPGLFVEVDESLATIKCNGETTATITAKASGGVGIYRYSLVDELSNTLRPFQTSGVFTNLGAGNYSIKAESNNCSPAFSKRIIINDLAPLGLSLKSGGINEIMALPTGGVGNYTFTFEGEYYDDIPSYIYYKTQDFLVTVQDANGCTASVSQKFNYIDLCTPNYFTPNGDGLNDTWAPGCSTNYTNLVFSIYDRYGHELGTFRQGQSWDGSHQGVPLPSGDYWYLLKLNNSKDDREFIGHFTLYR